MQLKTFYCGILCVYCIPTITYVSNDENNSCLTINNFVSASITGHKRRRLYGGSMRKEMFRWSADIAAINPARSLSMNESNLFSYLSVDEEVRASNADRFLESEDLSDSNDEYRYPIDIDIQLFPFVLILHDTYDYDTTIEKIALLQHSSRLDLVYFTYQLLFLSE